MTVDSNSLTMAQYAQMSNNPLVQAVVMSLIDNGSIMARDIPFMDRQSLLAHGVRFTGGLPTPNWSQINAEPVVGSAAPTPYQEAAYIIRDAADVDKYLVLDENQIADPREVQTMAHLKAIAYDFNDKFFNNDHVAGNANAPVGLKYRIANGTTYGVHALNSIDGGGVDITLATMTAAATKDSANKFLELLDQLLWAVDAPSGSPNVVLYMNDFTKRRMATALRALGTDGGFATTKDSFGIDVDTYKNCPIQDAGFKADQATRIIPGNGLTGSSAVGETAAGVASTGASALFTSIYAVNYTPGHFYGWQFAPIEAHDLGLLNNGSIYRTVIDWAGGFMNDSIRSIARLYDVKTGG